MATGVVGWVVVVVEGVVGGEAAAEGCEAVVEAGAAGGGAVVGEV